MRGRQARLHLDHWRPPCLRAPTPSPAFAWCRAALYYVPGIVRCALLGKRVGVLWRVWPLFLYRFAPQAGHTSLRTMAAVGLPHGGLRLTNRSTASSSQHYLWSPIIPSASFEHGLTLFHKGAHRFPGILVLRQFSRHALLKAVAIA